MIRAWWIRFGLYLIGTGLWIGALFDGLLNTPQWTPYLLLHPAVLVLYNVGWQTVVEAVPVLLAWWLLVRPDRLSIINAGRSLPSVALEVALAFVIGAPVVGWIAGAPQTGGWTAWLNPALASLAVAMGATLYFILGHVFELWRDYLSYTNHAIAIGMHWITDWIPWETGFQPITITRELAPLIGAVVAAELMVRVSWWLRRRYAGPSAVGT